MLSVSKSVYSTFMKKQNNGIKRIIEYPIETQNRVFFDLIARGQSTLWGKEHKYSFIHSIENYRDNFRTAIIPLKGKVCKACESVQPGYDAAICLD
jgi:hypothetical protein